MKPVRLAELCAATSLFTDLGTGQPVEHGLRTCLVSMRLADALNLDTGDRTETFYVALLRFLGCTADSYRAAETFGGDDLRFFSHMAPVTMGSSFEEISALAKLASGMSFSMGVAGVARALFDPTGKERLLDAHCEVASRLAGDMGLSANVCAALDQAYARWDGRGIPEGLAGGDIPISIRVSVMARDIELWGREVEDTRAVEILTARRGRAYDPEVVDAALDLGIDDLRNSDGDLWDAVLDSEPAPRTVVRGRNSIQRALRALGDFADLKVPEFTGHARRVESIVAGAGEIAGLSGLDAKTLCFSALVHDLGVVATPTGIWRNRSDLSPAETEQARLHPLWTERLLKRVDELETVAVLAGRHHERLDGAGYPRGLDGDLGRSVGLLACAEFYDEAIRRHGNRAQAGDELAELARSGGLAPQDVGAVLEAVGGSKPLIEVERPAGLTEREVDVLHLLARGNTNRQIADTLGISIKTAGSHVEHIYVKAGVRSRAAATLFAVKHQLV